MTAEVMTAEVPGNTTTGTPAFRARAFQFTLNEICFYDDFIEHLRSLKTCDYLISCQEVAPTTGHEHIHIYAHFSQTYKLPQKLLKYGAHIEICKGSPKQNINYIRKDGNILDEWGEVPHQGARSVAELRECSIDEVQPQYYRIKKEIDEDAIRVEQFDKMLNEVRNDCLQAPEIIYLSGDTGNGKTYNAIKMATERYANEDISMLQINNNFCTFTRKYAKCLIIPEFRPSQMHASEFLQLTDKYGYDANVKGGFVHIRPEMIIICSILPPTAIYAGEKNKQFLRRITKYYKIEDHVPKLAKFEDDDEFSTYSI